MSNFKDQMIDIIIQLNLDEKKLEDFNVNSIADTEFTVDARNKDNTITVYDAFCNGYDVKAITTVDRNVHLLKPLRSYMQRYNLAASQKLYVAGFSVGRIYKPNERDDSLFVILRTEGTIKRTQSQFKGVDIEAVIRDVSRKKDK